MSAYSSSEKFLQICRALTLEMLWPKAVLKTSISQIAWIQETQDNRRSFKKSQTWKRPKTISGGFKLISCTAADYKFLIRTSTCFCKIEIAVCFPRSKSRRAVKVWNRCSAFEIWTRCQESWKSSSKRADDLLKSHKTCHMLRSKRRLTNLWNHLKYRRAHTKASRGPAAPTRRSSSRRLCVPHLPRERQPGSSVYCAFCVLRLPRERQPESSVYCACHTKASRGPSAPTRAAPPPGGSVYCACHAKGSQEVWWVV